jgi:hypothetical protein
MSSKIVVDKSLYSSIFKASNLNAYDEPPA